MPGPDSLADEVARLYALPLDEFVAERNATAKAWKRDGRKDEAATIGGLRKPSVVESALNRTAQRDPTTTEAWADATRQADDAESATIGGADASALRTAVAGLRAATAAMIDAAVETIGDAGKRDDIAAYVRALPVGAAPQLVAGVLGSSVLPDEDLFAGAPTPPRRARPAPRAAKPAAASRSKPTPAPAPPRGPSARQRKLERTVEQRRSTLDALEAEVAAAEREADDARRRLDQVAARRDAAAAALRDAEADLASETSDDGS